MPEQEAVGGCVRGQGVGKANPVTVEHMEISLHWFPDPAWYWGVGAPEGLCG